MTRTKCCLMNGFQQRANVLLERTKLLREGLASRAAENVPVSVIPPVPLLAGSGERNLSFVDVR
jgi:hypothetical protein